MVLKLTFLAFFSLFIVGCSEKSDQSDEAIEQQEAELDLPSEELTSNDPQNVTGAYLTGQIQAPEGDNADRALVVLKGPVEYQTRVGGDGSFRIENINRGIYSLIAITESGSSGIKLDTVEIEGEGVDLGVLNLKPTGSISGIVFSVVEGNERVTHDGVEVYGSGLSNFVSTNTEGSFILPNVPEGTYDLTLSKQGFETIHVYDIEVIAGETKDIGQTYLALKGNAMGRVGIDTDAEKVEGRIPVSRNPGLVIRAGGASALMRFADNPNMAGSNWIPVSDSFQFEFNKQGNQSLYYQFAGLSGLEGSIQKIDVLVDVEPPVISYANLMGQVSETFFPYFELTVKGEDAEGTGIKSVLVSFGEKLFEYPWEEGEPGLSGKHFWIPVEQLEGTIVVTVSLKDRADQISESYKETINFVSSPLAAKYELKKLTSFYGSDNFDALARGSIMFDFKEDGTGMVFANQKESQLVYGVHSYEIDKENNFIKHYEISDPGTRSYFQTTKALSSKALAKTGDLYTLAWNFSEGLVASPYESTLDARTVTNIVSHVQTYSPETGWGDKIVLEGSATLNPQYTELHSANNGLVLVDIRSDFIGELKLYNPANGQMSEPVRTVLADGIREQFREFSSYTYQIDNSSFRQLRLLNRRSTETGRKIIWDQLVVNKVTMSGMDLSVSDEVILYPESLADEDRAQIRFNVSDVTGSKSLVVVFHNHASIGVPANLMARRIKKDGVMSATIKLNPITGIFPFEGYGVKTITEDRSVFWYTVGNELKLQEFDFSKSEQTAPQSLHQGENAVDNIVAYRWGNDLLMTFSNRKYANGKTIRQAWLLVYDLENRTIQGKQLIHEEQLPDLEEGLNFSYRFFYGSRFFPRSENELWLKFNDYKTEEFKPSLQIRTIVKKP